MTHLNVKRFVLQRHEQHSGDLARERHLPRVDVAVEVHHPLAHSRLVLQDASKRRPVLVSLRHLRMWLQVER